MELGFQNYESSISKTGVLQTKSLKSLPNIVLRKYQYFPKNKENAPLPNKPLNYCKHLYRTIMNKNGGCCSLRAPTNKKPRHKVIFSQIFL